MKTAIICTIGLVGSWGHAGADPWIEGRVQLDSGTPVPGAQVLLFDLTDLRAAPLAATTDRSGHFTLPLATLGGALPEQFELGANYPNPFNPSTMIPYQLPVSMQVRLEVFNILGQRIATLVDGERPAGFHTASWDATDAAGEAMGAGVYLYRLSGDGVQAPRSMLLIDGQAGIPSGRGGSSGSGGEAGAGEDGEAAPVYGLTVSGPGLVAYVDPAFGCRRAWLRWTWWSKPLDGSRRPRRPLQAGSWATSTTRGMWISSTPCWWPCTATTPVPSCPTTATSSPWATSTPTARSIWPTPGSSPRT